MSRIEDYAGMKNLNLDITGQIDEIAVIAHALSSPLRLRMIRLLSRKSMNLNELAQELSVPMSTVSLNVSVLERANLVFSELQPASRGMMKLCSRITDRIGITLVAMEERPKSTGQIAMPVGYYTDAGAIRATCGLAGPEGFLGMEDDPASFFLPEHVGAELLWLTSGYVEYRFPTMPLRGVELEWIEVSFEACSEVINYRSEYPSDIFVELNGVRIGEWTSPGDFGGRRGVLNPEWWPEVGTQFGQLKTWRVDGRGCYLDHMRIGDVGLPALGIKEGDYFTVRIGVDAEAEHVGGMNLFGKGFGDYPQDILVKYAYR